LQYLDHNIIKVKIGNKFVRALVDTGSSKTIIAARLAYKLGITNISKNKASSLITADGNSLKTVGVAAITIKIGNLAVPFDTYVASDLQNELILGLDFLDYTKVQIDCNARTVTFFDDLCGVNILQYHKALGRTMQKCKLPARSETIIQLHVNNVIDNKSYIMSPASIQGSVKYFIAKAVVSPQDNIVFCKLLNVTSNDVVIKRNVPLVALEQCHDSDIILWDDSTNINTYTNNYVNSINNNDIRRTNGNNSHKYVNCDKRDGYFGHNNVNRYDNCHYGNNLSAKQHHSDDYDKPRILADMGISIDNEKLNLEQKQKLTKLIEDNWDLFAYNLKQLPGTDLHPHVVETGNAPPQRSRPYRYTAETRQEIKRQTDEMLQAGIISPSCSLWSSPVVLVAKHGSSEKRFCVDYRKLNKVTVPISYPLPLFNDILDALAEKKPGIFSL
jgi:clan AA aspartic protease (TIGR02281 family)